MEPLLPTHEKPPNDFTIAVGVLVRSARQDVGLTQGELARLASVHRNTISNVEAGKVELSVSTLVMLAHVLDRPLSYFIPLQDVDWDAPLEAEDVAEHTLPQDTPTEETGFVFVEPEVQDYEEWKVANALKLAQVLAWIQAYSHIQREPTDEELTRVRESLIQAHGDRGVDGQAFTVKEIAEEWIRQNGGD